MKHYPFLSLAPADRAERDRMVEAVTRVIDSGCYIGGPEVERFEQLLCGVAGTERAVGVSNGLDALRLSLRALIETGRLQAGDRVAVQANAYIASLLAITDVGLRPVLVDVGLRSMIPDAGQLEAAARNGARAFMPVHLYGRAAWNADIAEVVSRYGMYVIEDNAQAIGATAPCPGVDGSSLSTGSLGHVAAFSFYPTKNIGALGDAGAVTTSDSRIADTVRALANYGSDRRYHNIYRGYNCRLDPVQAAVLAVKLDGLEADTLRRRSIAAVYSRDITLEGVTLPEPDPGSVWHQYVITHPDRDRLRRWLAERGVATDVHYAVPPHQQPCYAGMLDTVHLPVTDRLAATMVSLPIGLPASPSDAAEIAGIINCFI